MTVNVIVGDSRTALRDLAAGSAQCCVTSPPYFWQRDYGVDGQIGMEDTVDLYVSEIVSVFRDVKRCLRDDGVAWLNLGDAYYSGNGQPKGSDPRSPSRDWMRKKLRPLDVSGMGVPKKSLLGIPWKVAHALQDDGWTIRSEVVWCRKTAFAEPSVKDRPHRQHEVLFLLSKSRWYSFNRAVLPEESVWHIPHERAVRGHNAAFPEELVRRCILAGSAKGDCILDPFGGSGTTGVVAQREGRSAILVELNPTYAALAEKRIGSAFQLTA
jgi:DNA modification methylase